MVCPGGEVAFLSQMVRDSAVLRGRVHWYTSMVGKKSTLKAVKLALCEHGATAVRTTELAQGAPLKPCTMKNEGRFQESHPSY